MGKGGGRLILSRSYTISYISRFLKNEMRHLNRICPERSDGTCCPACPAVIHVYYNRVYMETELYYMYCRRMVCCFIPSMHCLAFVEKRLLEAVCAHLCIRALFLNHKKK